MNATGIVITPVANGFIVSLPLLMEDLKSAFKAPMMGNVEPGDEWKQALQGPDGLSLNEIKQSNLHIFSTIDQVLIFIKQEMQNDQTKYARSVSFPAITRMG